MVTYLDDKKPCNDEDRDLGWVRNVHCDCRFGRKGVVVLKERKKVWGEKIRERREKNRF